MRLERGQVAVVTGAASGIGLGIAQDLAQRGLDVVLADVEEAALLEAEEQLAPLGVRTRSVVVDVGDLDAVLGLAQITMETFGRVDVVCNNAGVNTAKAPTWELDENDWQWILGVNLLGVVHGIRAFVPHLVRANHGHVVNTASMAGLHPVAGLGPYAVSKRAVIALTECLRAELDDAAPAVGTTVVCPLWVWSRVRDAERNRPTALRRQGPAPDRIRPQQSTVEGEYKTPEEVAAQIACAIEAEQLYLLTHDSGRDEARAQQDRLTAVIGR